MQPSEEEMIQIDGNHLTIEDVTRVAREYFEVQLSKLGVENLEVSHRRLERALQQNRPIYGINTGYGIFSDRQIDPDEITRLNRNLILSHAVGMGEPLAAEVVRAAILVRANTLSKGYSGVRKVIVDALLSLLNKKITPIIPSQGSLGSSGDLSQLSHLAMVISTDDSDREDESGRVDFKGNNVSGKTALQEVGINRLILEPKEGLALNNGATFSTALAALSVYDAEYLWKVSNLTLAMSMEALRGCTNAFQEGVHRVRSLKGQIESAALTVKYLEGSELVNSTNRVQDAYSLRCAPQVHGAVLDTIQFVKATIENELNAANDNPLIFSEDAIYSGGNFHGEPVGLACDYLAIAMTELSAISERRIFRLVDGKLNDGLPAMLVDSDADAGLNSGYMMPQYTAASLVLENQTLASPDSVHSLPTSGSQEDHNANSMTAARHCRQVIENCRKVLAIELFTAARAVDLRLEIQKSARLGKGVLKAYQLIRKAQAKTNGDRFWKPQIEVMEKMITDRIFEI